MRTGAGTGLALAGCTEVSDGGGGVVWLPAEPDQDRPETRGWGPDALKGALPSLTQPLRPPQPQEREWRGRRLSGHLRVSAALRGCVSGLHLCLSVQTLLLRHLTNPNSDSKCCLSSLKKLCNKFIYGTEYHRFNHPMENVQIIQG